MQECIRPVGETPRRKLSQRTLSKHARASAERSVAAAETVDDISSNFKATLKMFEAAYGLTAGSSFEPNEEERRTELNPKLVHISPKGKNRQRVSPPRVAFRALPKLGFAPRKRTLGGFDSNQLARQICAVEDKLQPNVPSAYVQEPASFRKDDASAGQFLRNLVDRFMKRPPRT